MTSPTSAQINELRATIASNRELVNATNAETNAVAAMLLRLETRRANWGATGNDALLAMIAKNEQIIAAMQYALLDKTPGNDLHRALTAKVLDLTNVNISLGAMLASNEDARREHTSLRPDPLPGLYRVPTVVGNRHEDYTWLAEEMWQEDWKNINALRREKALAAEAKAEADATRRRHSETGAQS